MIRFQPSVLLATLCVSLTACRAGADEPDRPPVEKHLIQGELADGQAAMSVLLKASPDDQQARFSLGVVQFLQAVEGLAQNHYEYGLLQSRVGQIPFLRMPVPKNPKPKKISYRAARGILQEFINDLALAESTLAGVEPDGVKLPLHFGRIRLDLDGSGDATEEETLWKIFQMLNAAVRREEGEAFKITFDGGDVYWLRGYCHLLMSLGEIALAHDCQNLFERTAHLFYPNVESPYRFLQEEQPGPFNGFNTVNFLDAIAVIHLINFPVKEPGRMKVALAHMEAMIDLSRKSWKLIQAEMDDDHEWLPNPKQTGVIPNVRVRQEMIDGWHEFLGEMDHLLKGTKLMPFWRGVPGRSIGVLPVNANVGINLRRVFTEPRQFDLVLWLQGTGAAPYLEEGQNTDRAVWERLARVFGGEFFGFAIWFN